MLTINTNPTTTTPPRTFCLLLSVRGGGVITRPPTPTLHSGGHQRRRRDGDGVGVEVLEEEGLVAEDVRGGGDGLWFLLLCVPIHL